MEWLNIAVLALYLVGMIAFGVWGARRIKNTADYLVAGRNLGGTLYAGTMVAVMRWVLVGSGRSRSSCG